ncbi:uncharacterized protein PGTG_14958 [Puccinia graminis f. sp. tritici CRL 75-36-700-3]|uniref:hAT-like transposase RNase-H fold domain-containing protein n=1 Tax=Puccinia graminis f. sp. tritici (strain CRL 75-36-700-3 / race SCCL) TaxID=418459 RepID=E3KXQ5_PUCGT|nr:uncharacterized protein PGTG_14958 [Puccinia graminis f. sp. tritici CRL 75-36-700-3]EFP89117.1 hypothetical protein PGTG_14958 [Puccinia graminis f. sp. tritici CRL 75-36-700-3]
MENKGNSGDNSHIHAILEPMQIKFEKYWTNMKEFSALITIFDLLYFHLANEEREDAATDGIKQLIKKVFFGWLTSYTSNISNTSTGDSFTNLHFSASTRIQMYCKAGPLPLRTTGVLGAEGFFTN